MCFNPCGDDSVIHSCVRWNSNSGFPHLSKKYDSKWQFEEALKTLSGNHVPYDASNVPAAVFSRTSAAEGGGYKRRGVYCPPFFITVIEIFFGKNILDYFLSNTTQNTIIMGRTQSQISELVTSFSGKHRLCLDFKKFDLRLPPEVILLSFDIIRHWLNLDKAKAELF
jgi:hypothetical protein